MGDRAAAVWWRAAGVGRVRRVAEHHVLVVHAVRDGLRGVLADVKTVETAVHPVVLREETKRLNDKVRVMMILL